MKTLRVICVLILAFAQTASVFPPEESDPDICYIEIMNMDNELVVFPVDCDWSDDIPRVYPRFRWSKQYWTCRTINNCFFGRIGKG